MISRIRNSILTKVLWALTGLYLLNISVDIPDPDPEHIPEDLSLNDQESIVEIIVEQVLGYEDAIKEHDDPDTENHNGEKNVKIELLVYQVTTNEIAHQHFIKKEKFYLDHEARLMNGFKEVTSPPPKI